MKIAKWFLFAATALVCCGACDDKDNEEPAPAPDKIAITPKTANVSSKGGEASVMVTSSGEWTLTGDANDYVTPSALKGKDGDIVKFTVKPNDKEEDQTFNYTFTCGKATASYAITLKKKASQAEEQLEITFVPESNILPREGGNVSVLVTSSDEWTLEGSHTFVHPSATSGSDGAEVTFAVDPNETEEDKVADYVFKMGSKNVPFRITVKGGVIYTLEIVGEKELKFAYTKQEKIAVTLNTNVPYRDLAAEITSTEEGWLTKGVTVQGATETEVIMYFDLTQNDGLDPREASVKITGPKGGEDILKIKQMPQSQISVEELSYYLETTGAALEIPVAANVAFDVTLSESAGTWFAYSGFTDGKLKFTYQDLPEGTIRSCTATLTEKKPAAGAQPLTVVLMFSQKSKGMITTAVNMTGTRAWPAWNDPAPVTNMKAFTLEALVNPTVSRYSGSLSTIMGIEGKFLVRLGDVGIPWNQVQVCWDSGRQGTWGNVEGKLSNSNMKVNLNEWTHIAVTFGEGTVKVFINGVEKGSTTTDVPASVNFGVAHNDEQAPQGQPITRCFWVGYSYESVRDFRGMMSELRIWNRALTASELAEEARRYDVDPKADGLVTYWKCDEGQGDVIKDYTSYRNDLASDGLKWEPVSLP
ncbi:LamG-like jellyroll fold domain-containing protein [Alistipes shahii]|uniref:LamG-like jellyroll fold domain-containing protein n=1 Tax=Alistipes shahii TaxID=328814 RepID=UPI00266F0892|nr:LamG-like jellyroll fold domain-containing protein [Alistipes shahii]